ncbi:MAG: TetR/AcrR family transcriptional regulator [Planctomycetota bacterium]|jgi:AcrR family transcriptional regulator
MGTGDRKQREKEARRLAILGAAKEVFFEKGFHGATMDQIAERGELGKGTLYLYFPSKEDLYVSLLLEGLEILRGMMEEGTQGTDGWDNKIVGAGWAYYGFSREHRNFFRILFHMQNDELFKNVSPELYQRCIQKGLSCLAILAEAVHEGMEKGEIAKGNPMEAAMVLWGFTNGVILLYEEEKPDFFPSSLEDSIRLGMKITLDGLRKR